MTDGTLWFDFLSLMYRDRIEAGTFLNQGPHLKLALVYDSSMRPARGTRIPLVTNWQGYPFEGLPEGASIPVAGNVPAPTDFTWRITYQGRR